MEKKEIAEHIDLFLKNVVTGSFAMTIEDGTNLTPYSEEEIVKIRTIERYLKRLNLVQIVNGGDNSEMNGLYRFFASALGEELVDENKSSLTLLNSVENRDDSEADSSWEM